MIDRRQLTAGLVAGLGFGICSATKAQAPADLSAQARGLLQDHKVPGLGFGLVRAGRIARAEAFGWADVGAQRPATPDTAFHLASVSKVVTGTALMQLHQAGRFKLDDPIGPHLDFPVVNPRHPEPITFRQVFTHTSTISDRNYDGFQQVGDPTLPLRDFLVGYLTPGGKWFTDKTFGDAEPGSRFSYSNVGTALAGYLAERIDGRSLKTQCRERLFKPLRMAPAAWTLADLQSAPVATPYAETDGKLGPIPPVGYPDWPAGLLRASPRAMTRFIAAYANGGTFDGATILSPETVRTMLEITTPPPLPRGPLSGQGLFWEGLAADRPGLIGKIGGDDGAHALIAVDPTKGNGVVMLANRSPTEDLQAAMVRLAVAALA